MTAISLFDTVRLPAGWRLLGVDPIALSFAEENDTPAVRYRLDVNGHDVQVIYDGSDNCVTVFVGEKMELLRKSEIAAYIRKWAR